MEKNDNVTIYRRLIGSKAFFLFLIPFFLALLIGIFQQFYYRYQINRELDRINAEISDFKKQKEDLSALVDYYKNESNLENEARIRLNLKKEGEKVVIILPMATSTESGNNGTGGGSMEDNFGTGAPNYKQWWYYFFPPKTPKGY